MAAPLSASSSSSASAATTGSFVKTWEQSAELSARQLDVLGSIKALVKDRPLPSFATGGSKEGDGATANAEEKPVDVDDETFLDFEEIKSAQQFHEFYANVQAHDQEEHLQQYRDYLGRIKEYRSDITHMISEVHATIKDVDELKESHTFVSTKTESLYNACESLVKEKNQLVGLVESIRARLAYFEELDALAKALNSKSLRVTSDEFSALLVRLDECIVFVANNPSFKESSSYLLRFRSLQNRALTTIKSYAVDKLRAATASALTALTAEHLALSTASGVGSGAAVGSARSLREKGEEGEGEAGLVTAWQSGVDVGTESALYIKFMAIAPMLSELMAQIETRTSRPEYASLLYSCQECYYDQRTSLISGIVEARVKQLKARCEDDSVTLCREGCLYLVSLCKQEYTLFGRFFDTKNGISQDFFEGFCSSLYRVLLPLFIHENSITTLAMLCSVLKLEILDEAIGSNVALASFRPLVQQMLADVRARLSFRAQMYIRDQIAGFNPGPEHLDYPNFLIKARAKSRAIAAGERTEATLKDMYSTWYPSLEYTLLLLSQLYRSIDRKTFEGLAQDAVMECTASLVFASKLVGQDKSARAIHGPLFLIKHLLILKEQISPFQVSFASIERVLDFSYLAGAWQNIVANSSSLLRMSSDNALLALVNPRVTETQVDAVKRLDSDLQNACQEFIDLCKRRSLQPLVTFFAKVDAFETMRQSRPELNARLSQQAWASATEVAEVVRQSREVLSSQLPSLFDLLDLYLSEAKSGEGFMAHVKRHTELAYKRLRELCQDYPADVQASLGIPTVEEVDAMFAAAQAELHTVSKGKRPEEAPSP